MFWSLCLDPRVIISAASIVGGLYFIRLCLEDAKTLWHHRTGRYQTPLRTTASPPVKRPEFRADLAPSRQDDRLWPLLVSPQSGD